MITLRAAARITAVILVLMASLSIGPAPVVAETAAVDGTVTLPADLTPEQLNELIARMSDTEVRQLLLDRLATSAAPVDAASEVAPDPVSLLNAFVATVIEATKRHGLHLTSVGATLAALWAVFSAYVAGLGASGLLIFVAVFALAIGLGAAAEIAVNRMLKRWRPQPPTDTQMPLPQKLALIGKHFVRETIDLLIFFVVVSVTLRLFMPVADLPVARIIAIWLIIFPRFGNAMLRFFLVPSTHAVLEVNSEEWTRRYLYQNLSGIIMTIGVALALMKLIALWNGLPDAYRVGFWLNLLVFVWLGVMFMRARKGIILILKGDADSATVAERWMAGAYPVYALSLVILTWVLAALAGAAGFEYYLRNGSHLATLLLLLSLPLLDSGVRAVVLHFIKPMHGEGGVAAKAHNAARNSYVRMARVLLLGVSLALFARLWGISLTGVNGASAEDKFADNIIVVAYILLTGYLVWEIARLLINRKLATEFTASQGLPRDEDSTAIHIDKGSSRLATVLPIFSWMVQSVIIALTVLMALSNLGIDVTALVAGLSIFGLAIGFGSQKLVSDIVSGMFFLMEDAFRIGEYVDVGNVQGTIEKFSLRSMQLRESKGAIYCVPYSTIPRVTNFGRDWGIMKLKFTFPFGTNVDQIRKIFKKIGQEMMDNPDLKEGFIEPFKSQGVREITDAGVVIGCKFMFKPGTQFTIRKEIYRLIQRDLDAAGIKFARPEVHVIADGGAGDKETLAAAAGRLIASKADSEVKA